MNNFILIIKTLYLPTVSALYLNKVTQHNEMHKDNKVCKAIKVTSIYVHAVKLT